MGMFIAGDDHASHEFGIIASIGPPLQAGGYALSIIDTGSLDPDYPEDALMMLELVRSNRKRIKSAVIEPAWVKGRTLPNRTKA